MAACAHVALSRRPSISVLLSFYMVQKKKKKRPPKVQNIYTSVALECIATCVSSNHLWSDLTSLLYMQINERGKERLNEWKHCALLCNKIRLYSFEITLKKIQNVPVNVVIVKGRGQICVHTQQMWPYATQATSEYDLSNLSNLNPPIVRALSVIFF